MDLKFYKYHGTGNDFVLMDNREVGLSGDLTEYFAWLCHRRFGVGADGVILLNNHPDYDFEMDYFNSDGRRSSMCGNGGRCIVQFASDLGLIQGKARFLAVDGPHEASLQDGLVKLKMGLPHGYEALTNGDYWVHTGSPHYVRFVEGDLSTLDVFHQGRAVRNSPTYVAEGTNVNFVSKVSESEAHVRTYERGVEDETWSCGTGVTAVAEVMARLWPGGNPIKALHTPGGDLHVHTSSGEAPWLEGPATFVFEGNISYPQRHSGRGYE